MMRKLYFGGLALSLALCLMAAGPVQAAQVDRIVAVVNDEIITLKQLQKRMSSLVSSKKLPAGQQSELERKVLEAMIDQTLVNQVARKQGAMVSEAEIDQAISGIIAENNLTDAQFKASLVKSGTSYASFREDIKAELIKNRILGSSVMNRVVVTDKEVNAFLSGSSPKLGSSLGGSASMNYGVRMIFIADKSKSSAKERARKIKSEIAGGLDFAEAAGKYSQGPGRDKGGDPGGGVTVGQLQPALRAAVAGLKPGQVSEPVEAEEGVILLTVVPGVSGGKPETKSESTDFDTVFSPDEIQAARRQLEQMKMQERYLEWMNNLRSSAIIKVTL